MNEFVKKASIIPTLTTIEERETLSELALKVPPKGTILEIGALYGGVTAVLALSAPTADVFTIDDFSWHPAGMPITSKKLLMENMSLLNINNVTVIEGTSKDVSRRWQRNIDLLWIDGGHDYKTVFFDLTRYSRQSNVIALHDYRNPVWQSIEQAIITFLASNSHWQFDYYVDSVAVLRKREE